MHWKCVLLGIPALLCMSAVSARGQQEMDYLAVVGRYADVMIDHGRDRYGAGHSPLFAVALDRRTRSFFQGEALEDVLALKRIEWGIRNHDGMVQVAILSLRGAGIRCGVRHPPSRGGL